MSTPANASILTYADLGRLLGVTRQRAHQLARADNWPFGAPPWPRQRLADIRSWHAARRSENNATADGDQVSEAQQARDLGMSVVALRQLHDAMDADDYPAALAILDR